VIDDGTVETLGVELPVRSGLDAGTDVTVEIPFDAVDLLDNVDDGLLAGEVYFILYMGNHYHLTVKTEDGDFLYVDTNDIWDKGDLVGINFKTEGIRARLSDE
jgi:spermidine/putrescine transport system ATP-binding protein